MASWKQFSETRKSTRKCLQGVLKQNGHGISVTYIVLLNWSSLVLFFTYYELSRLWEGSDIRPGLRLIELLPSLTLERTNEFCKESFNSLSDKSSSGLVLFTNYSGIYSTFWKTMWHVNYPFTFCVLTVPKFVEYSISTIFLGWNTQEGFQWNLIVCFTLDKLAANLYEISMSRIWVSRLLHQFSCFNIVYKHYAHRAFSQILSMLIL